MSIRTRLHVVSSLVGLLGVIAAVLSMLAWYRAQQFVDTIRSREALRSRVIDVQTDSFRAMKRFVEALDAIEGARDVETLFARVDSELGRIEAMASLDSSLFPDAGQRDRLLRLRVLVRERRRIASEILRRKHAGEQVGDFLKDSLTQQMDREFLALISLILDDISAGVYRAEDDMLDGVQRFRFTIGPVGVATIVVVIALLLGVSRRIRRSLDLLLDGTERLAAGDLEARVNVAGSDEFHRLSEAFNEMSSSLGRSALEVEQAVGKREEAQARLREGQKMEAIGRLAGGVAHDFNNLLQVINGYADMLLESLAESDDNRDHARQIRRTGERAALLTRQLLAFGRRQVVQPRPLSLNASIAGMESMMERLVGEMITVVTELDPELKEVIADEAQVEQMLMNLIINAQQAMPNGGTLTLRTSNVELQSDTGPPELREVAPGPYAQLEVRDSGVGMGPETLDHIFEPFYTTRDVGDGTGLGLATVYGSVKQSKGRISVSSEVGQGTAFRIYLPQDPAAVVPDVEPAADAQRPTRGPATIMVVEDSGPVRKLIRRVLERYGYNLLEARDGEHALQVAEEHGGPIHLLVTDVVMPGLNGRRLALLLLKSQPRIKVLYISGYPRDALLRHGVEQDEVPFLQKPFTESELLSMVYELLGVEGGEQA